MKNLGASITRRQSVIDMRQPTIRPSLSPGIADAVERYRATYGIGSTSETVRTLLLDALRTAGFLPAVRDSAPAEVSR